MLLTYNQSQPIFPNIEKDGTRRHFYDRGTKIPLINHGVWQVEEGVVQLSKFNPSGEEVLLGWSQPSTFFGMGLTSNDAYQGKALSDVSLLWYSLAEIEASPNLAHNVLTQVVRRMRQTEALLAIAGMRRVEDRLLELLQLLKQDLGQPLSEGTRLVVRFTHQNLANAIGTTRVTVTRLLGHFQRQGYVSFDSDRHMIIHQ